MDRPVTRRSPPGAGSRPTPAPASPPRLGRASLALLATAACATSPAAPPEVASIEPTAPAATDRSPAAWRAALARFDAASDAAARARLAPLVDRAAGQRHATVSRLYWHPDLAAARAAAAVSGKPILALRMLGRLDEELSCANSRFFRVALYADRDLSTYLAARFELTWSSERPVPVARIDFGDGRVLVRTVAGNSAHHVLDSRGRPVDVLPGLMPAAQFRAALERAEAIARAVAELDDAAQVEATARFHAAALAEGDAAWSGLGEIAVPRGVSLAEAERRAMSKALVELPVVDRFELGPRVPPDDARLAGRAAPAWDVIGQRLPAAVLDAQSRGLIAALAPIDWTRAGRPLAEDERAPLIAAFERILVRDGAYNRFVLHRQIHRWFARGEGTHDLTALSARVHAELFLTPADDPWLGMATPGVFTALPADGLVAARPPR